MVCSVCARSGLPQIRKSPFVFVAAGRSAQLTCSADSIPKPDPITGFTWSLRGRVITNSARCVQFTVRARILIRVRFVAGGRRSGRR